MANLWSSVQLIEQDLLWTLRRSFMRNAYFLFTLLLAYGSAFAEMEKIAVQCDKNICFHWWPKLSTVSGWHHDRDHSVHYSFNAQAPDGKTFANAEAVIYANAPFKPRIAEVKTLQMLIENDQQQFRTDSPGVEILEVEPLLTGDGSTLRSFTYTPTIAGNWEQVSYGEEGEFYLIFTVSSRSKQGFAEALTAYKKFINAYKTSPQKDAQPDPR
jgi:hypothetical protein